MKWFHKLLKGSTLATALFIFQACYGTPLIEPVTAIKVVSAEDDSPLKDIKVYQKFDESTSAQWDFRGYTDENGYLEISLYAVDGLTDLRFEPVDKKYADKDTTIDISQINSSILIKLKKTAE